MGREHYLIGWEAVNLVADRFWRRHGFRLLGWRLLRVVDERIAWMRLE